MKTLHFSIHIDVTRLTNTYKYMYRILKSRHRLKIHKSQMIKFNVYFNTSIFIRVFIKFYN